MMCTVVLAVITPKFTRTEPAGRVAGATEVGPDADTTRPLRSVRPGSSMITVTCAGWFGVTATTACGASIVGARLATVMVRDTVDVAPCASVTVRVTV